MLEGAFCIGEGSGDNKVPHRSRVVPVGGGGGGGGGIIKLKHVRFKGIILKYLIIPYS